MTSCTWCYSTLLHPKLLSPKIHSSQQQYVSRKSLPQPKQTYKMLQTTWLRRQMNLILKIVNKEENKRVKLTREEVITTKEGMYCEGRKQETV